MGWLALLTAVLPLLKAILALFEKAKSRTNLPPRAMAKLQELNALCSQVSYHSGRCGVGFSAVDSDDGEDSPET